MVVVLMLVVVLVMVMVVVVVVHSLFFTVALRRRGHCRYGRARTVLIAVGVLRSTVACEKQTKSISKTILRRW